MKRVLAVLAALLFGLGLMAAPAAQAANPKFTIQHGVDNAFVNKDCASADYSDGYSIGICTYTRYTNSTNSTTGKKTLFYQQTKYYCSSPSRIVACQGVYFKRNANLDGVTSGAYGGGNPLYRQCGVFWDGVGPAPSCPSYRDDNDIVTTHVKANGATTCYDPWWTQITTISIRTNGHTFSPAGLRTAAVQACYYF